MAPQYHVYRSKNVFYSSNRWFFQQKTFVICQTFLIALIWFLRSQLLFKSSKKLQQPATSSLARGIKQTKIICFCFNNLFYWILFMRFNVLCQIWWYIWSHNWSVLKTLTNFFYLYVELYPAVAKPMEETTCTELDYVKKIYERGVSSKHLRN